MVGIANDDAIPSHEITLMHINKNNKEENFK